MTPPKYDLDEIKELLKNEDTRIITRIARFEAVRLGYPDDDAMVDRVLILQASEFYKTMQADTMPGLWQDVYRSDDATVTLYIKLQISFNGQGVIISFKEK
ncbi:MAG: type II toxin-antitoxin system MqsR family toxin [Deltaproteobacteria bacterium]|nr:type II toxin-antitoxin system MqsR family toxin [Deltaproteobacteria bacterium]